MKRRLRETIGKGEPRSVSGDADRLPHNTLSAAKQDVVVVHYPFHPLCGRQLEVFTRPRSGEGAFVVDDGNGKRLKIPVWMVVAGAAESRLSETRIVNATALLQLVEFWELHFGKLPRGEATSEMETSHETAMVNRPATGT